MTFAKTERDQLCTLLLEVGPDAPTLCEGWTTHDLAAHLWVREADPLGAPGIVVSRLASVTKNRMDELKQRWSYAELVEKLRNGPGRWSVFAIPGLDEQANAVEFFIHHEDVRRAGSTPAEQRNLPEADEDALWRRLKLMSRALFRKAKVGVVLERGRSDATATASASDTIRAMSGAQTVTLVGEPQELMLYAYGRRDVAHVRTIGEPDAIAALKAADLSL